MVLEPRGKAVDLCFMQHAAVRRRAVQWSAGMRLAFARSRQSDVKIRARHIRVHLISAVILPFVERVGVLGCASTRT